MTLLPIVGRELRIASRQASTYWLRCLASAVALATGSAVFFWSRNVSPAEMGQHLLITLGILTFAFSLFAGVFITADCLAEEKREGTLGLLFLTDLKAYDVVLGKLAATSLHAVFGLAAIIPVLALPLLMGGVTGGEFARLLLVFAGTLFFSLNLGLLISAYSHDARQAYTRGLLGVAVFAGLFPLLHWLDFVCYRRFAHEFLFWPSPACAFFYGFEQQYAPRNGPDNFWTSTALIWFLSFIFLLWTNLALPGSWQQTGEPRKWFRRKTREVKPRTFLRRRVYHENPVFWLAMGDASGQSLAKRTLAWLAPLCFLFMVLCIFTSQSVPAFCAAFFMAYGLHLLVKVYYVTEASQRMFRERQSGAFELLLVTPISVKEILTGQQQALRRQFKGPFITLCSINLGLMWLVAAFPGALDMRWQEQEVFMECFAGGILVLWLDFRALTWVGMSQGLTARRGHRAVLGAVGRIMGLPWLIVFFLVITKSFFNSSEEAAVTVASWFLISALIDLVSGYVARKKLERGFRDVALRRFQPGT